MKFQKATREKLLRLAANKENYPGGTNRDFQGMKAYIRTKKLTSSTGLKLKAAETYEFCSYRKSTNAKDAETKLLQACGGVCPYNIHAKSNLTDQESGYVYVLHN